MAKPFYHPPVKDIKLDGILHALADPSRRRILFKLMGCSGMNCSKSCGKMPPSTVSFHYRVLREAGLIRSKKKGVEVINAVRQTEIEKRFPGLLHTIFRHHKKIDQK